MGMNGVLRPAHVALRVMDLDAAVRHYTEVLGLIESGRDTRGRVYLKAWDEHDHHCLVLEKSDRAGLEAIGWKVRDEQTLVELTKALGARGVETSSIPAGEQLATGRRVRFRLPTGHLMDLFAAKDIVGNGMPTTNPGLQPDGLKGAAVMRLDHILLYGADLDGAVATFTDVLGFQVTERVVDGDIALASFLSCGTKVHDIAFVRHPENAGKIHHVAFYVEALPDVMRAADIVAAKDVVHDIGPTRHGISRGQTVYFFDPSGNRNEVFTGGYIWYPDRPPLTWTADQLDRALLFHERRIKETFLSVFT